jgi:O-antigen/teichoic acid export membrane protein
MQFPAALAVAEKALFAVLGFGGLHFRDSVIVLAVAYVAAHGVTQIISFVLLRSELQLKSTRFEYLFLKSLVQSAFPFFGISLIAALYASIDRFFLFSMAGSAAVGIYAAVYRLVSVPTYFSSSFHQAVFPRLSRQAGLFDQTKLNEAIESSVRYLTFAAVPFAIGTTVLAEPIIRLNPFFSRVLFALERQRLVMTAALAGTALNIVLNIILIPSLSVVGAATATLASAAVIFAVLYVPIRRRFPSLSLTGSVLKACVSGGLMWVVLLVLKGIPVILLICVAGVTYLLSLILTRAISLDEIPVVSRSLGITARSSETVSYASWKKKDSPKYKA